LDVSRTPVTLTVPNVSPYPIRVIIGHYDNSLRFQTAGWKEVDPGNDVKETVLFKDVWFQEKEPVFFVYVEGLDPAIVRRIHNLPLTHDGLITWQGMTRQCVSPGGFALVANADGTCGPHDSLDLWTSFASVVVENSNPSQWYWLVQDAQINFYPNGIPGTPGIAEAGRAANGLWQAVKTWPIYDATWLGKVFPYHLGVKLTDQNGEFNPGVSLEPFMKETIDGAELPFRKDDELLSIDDHPCFRQETLRCSC
jgi:hypothetical protein